MFYFFRRTGAVRFLRRRGSAPSRIVEHFIAAGFCGCAWYLCGVDRTFFRISLGSHISSELISCNKQVVMLVDT